VRKTYLYQVNVTRDCNLRCTHCYISSDVKKISGKMDADSFVRVFDGIAEHMQSIGYTHAEIHVIGGEPTMLGLDFFNSVMPRARAAVADKGFTAEIMMVTNLLSRDMLPIARHFDRINTSYEVETRFPKPKLEQWWRNNLQMLRDNGIDVGVTTAVTQQVVDFGARNMLEHHYSRGIKQIHFGFFIPSGDGGANRDTHFPSFIDTSRFLIETAEWYFERRDDDPDLFVNPAESMLSAIAADRPLDDIVCPIIAGAMDIDFDGRSATCLEAGGDLDAKWLGNVFETSVKAVAESAQYRREVVRAARPANACMDCEEYWVCRSGCGVNHKYWDPAVDEDCPGFKSFIKHMRNAHAAGMQPRYAEYRGKVAF